MQTFDFTQILCQKCVGKLIIFSLNYSLFLPGAVYDMFTESFGPRSACIKMDESSQWHSVQCSTLIYPHISGAGCYTVGGLINFEYLLI